MAKGKPFGINFFNYQKDRADLSLKSDLWSAGDIGHLQNLAARPLHEWEGAVENLRMNLPLLQFLLVCCGALLMLAFFALLSLIGTRLPACR